MSNWPQRGCPISKMYTKLTRDKYTSIDSLNLQYGQVILVTLAYMEGCKVVWMYSCTVTKTKFSCTDGLPCAHVLMWLWACPRPPPTRQGLDAYYSKPLWLDWIIFCNSCSGFNGKELLHARNIPKMMKTRFANSSDLLVKSHASCVSSAQ